MEHEEKLTAAKSILTSKELLIQLTNEESVEILHAVACNLAAPAEALLKLSENEKADSSVLEQLSYAFNTPAEALDSLADHRYYYVAYGASRHPNTTSETLAKLANHSEAPIQRNVASHPSATLELLVKLIKSNDYVVANAARDNPVLLSSLRQKALAEGICGLDYDMPLDWLLTLYSD